MNPRNASRLAALALALIAAQPAVAADLVEVDGLTVYGAEVLPLPAEAVAPHLYASGPPVAGDPTAILAFVAPAAAEVWVDGRRVAGEQVEVVAGRHLVQVVLGEEAPVRSLLLQLEADARALVTVPSALLQPPREVLGEAVSDVVTLRGSRTAPVFLAVGAGLAAIGGVVTAVGARQLDEFNGRITDGTLSPFPSSSAVNPEEYAYYRVWQSHTRDVTVGCALLGVGAGIMVLSIPIEAAHRSAQVGVTAAVPLTPDGPRGFALGVVIR
jgi:hypothetical protein